MIDARVFEISRRLTDVNLQERWDLMRSSIVQCMNDFVARGMGQSSALVQAIGHVCAADARAAVDIAWKNIWRTALNIGVEPSQELASELKSGIRAQTETHYNRMVENFREHEGRIGIVVPEVQEDLTKARRLALAQMDAEVDLAVASLVRRAEMEEGRSVYQFYAPVGAVVSGPRASASVVQNIGAQEKAELTAALQGLTQAITRSVELRDDSKGELIELVGDARSELDRPKPNGLHLTSVLVGIGQAVQTIGSVAPAYQAVKAAAALCGVQLP